MKNYLLKILVIDKTFLVVTIYLGTIIYFKTNNGLAVLIAWTIWVFGVPVLLEAIDFVIKRRLQSKF